MLGPPRPDWLAVVVGRTGRGKSGFALQVAAGAAVGLEGGGGSPVLYMSAEMSTAELLARILAAQAVRGREATVRPPGKSPRPHRPPAWRDIMRGAVPDDLVKQAAGILADRAPFLYLWAPKPESSHGAALEDMARAVATAHGAAPLVVVDYVQRLVGGTDERRGAVSDLSARLRSISRPSEAQGYPGAAVLALSSTARGYYPHFRDAPTLLRAHRGGWAPKIVTSRGGPTGGAEWVEPIDLEGMGKESGELEYDAPALLCLTCDPQPWERWARPTVGASAHGPPDLRRGVLVVAKNRAGSTGWLALDFHGPTGTWHPGNGEELGALTTLEAAKKQAEERLKERGAAEGGAAPRGVKRNEPPEPYSPWEEGE